MIISVRERAQNGPIEPVLMHPESIMAFCREDTDQVGKKRVHAANHLYALRAVGANLIEGQIQKVVPGGDLTDEKQPAHVVPNVSDFQPAAPQANQQIFDFIERLDSRSGIVYRW